MPIDHVQSRRFLRRALIYSLALASMIFLILLGPDLFWASVSESHVRLGFVKGLEFVRAAFIAGAFAASLGAIGLGAVLIRARKRKRRRPIVARICLLCVASLFGLASLETAASAWRNWRHATPLLPNPPKSTTRSARESPNLSDRLNTNEEELNLVVLGGSSAFGVPYDHQLSIGSIVAWGLERASPKNRVRLKILAAPGIHLERNHEKLAQIDRKPDILLIHVGDNEFSYRYTWDRTSLGYYFDHPSRTFFAKATSRASAFCALIAEAIAAQRRGEVPPERITRKLVDLPICSAEESAGILADFRRRLDAIVAWADSLGTIVVLIVPPTNDADFEPNRSVLPRDSTRLDREEFAREFDRARGLESNDPRQSMKLYEGLIARYPDFAETRYRRGALLRRARRFKEADEEFIRARDLDAFPVRCPTAFQDVIREVGARRGAIVVDAPVLFRAKSRHGLTDFEFFHDAMHPTLRGQALLADEILKRLRVRGDFERLDAEDCARKFGLDVPGAWRFVCEQERAFYQVIAYLRYDPAERLARAARYAEAVRRIDAGEPPEKSTIPGVGVKANRPKDARRE